MYKFMIVTFCALGWGFYVMSGGSDFEPAVRATADTGAEAVVVEAAAEPAAEPVVEPVVAAVVPTPTEAIAQEGAEPVALSSLSDALTQTNTDEETPVTISLTAEPAAVPVVVTADPDPVDLRRVAGSRVNMRSGPGTDYGVLATLSRGEQAEVLEVDATGWARIRVIGSGQIGWMAERLLQTF